MKFLNKILGINLPSIDNVKKQAIEEATEEESKENSVLGYISFILMKDGVVNVKTDWVEENSAFANVYSQLLYQINSGTLEDGILNVLIKYGAENVKSQVFISEIINGFRQLQQKYKNMPLISPSQALRVNKE
jgi:hypothetical protein